ncbi:MAG: hypothetical protein KBF28_13555 [Gemmatimonadales bacterium]|nr:hypothetical protein [Gemmatimonadales bacterium]
MVIVVGYGPQTTASTFAAGSALTMSSARWVGVSLARTTIRTPVVAYWRVSSFPVRL